MRTVEVRILPPQPISALQNNGIGGVVCFYADCTAFMHGLGTGQFRCFQPATKYPLREETTMARKAEATLRAC
jgi:hypothetical protein